MKLEEELKQVADDGCLDKMFEDMERQEQIAVARAAWFEGIGPDKRATLIHRAIEKYASDEYRDREYRNGYEPRTPFFEFLFNYAGRYGKEMPCDFSVYFQHTYRLIDGKWLVREMNGQGTVYDVTEYNGETYWQTNTDAGLDIRFYTLHKKLEREIESFLSANGITNKELFLKFTTGESSTLTMFNKRPDIGIARPEKPVLYSDEDLC